MTNDSRYDWDIFCQVIDNFGDIGVCWRLARQLADEYGYRVRLWIDQVDALKTIWPDTRLVEHQTLAGVDVSIWGPDTSFTSIIPAQAVIEAFACELPPAYLDAMARQSPQPRWLNLEYLSAEEWVEGCHGLRSRHPRLGLDKQFFFPGFTPATGGLLREHGLLAARDAFQGEQRAAFLSRWGVDARADRLFISLFGYENPSLASLIRAWQEGPHPVTGLIPEGRLLTSLNRQLGLSLTPGQVWKQGNLELLALPFLRQTEYDHLLWACDLNLVRGEDSFVRAQWAAKPLIWHIYFQDDEAHLHKLDAFLDRYTQAMAPELASAVRQLWRDWNQGNDCTLSWQACISHYPEWLAHSRRWSAGLDSLGDLAAKLVQFCKKTL